MIKVINCFLVVLFLIICWQIIVALMLPTAILQTQRSAVESNNIASGQWQWFDDSYVVTQQSLDKASLQAKVLGVVMRGEQSVALISLPGRPETVYRVGDKINNTTSLEAVEAHRIVLRENGVLRELALEKLGASNSSTRAILRQTKPADNDETLAILNMARAVPVTVEGGSGLRLDDLSEQIQQLSELKSGDIILSVEGQDVMSLKSGNNWQSLMNKTDAQVNLLRDGQALTIQVNVASLAQQMMQSLTN